MTAEDVANIGFKVVVDGFMTETAKTADYVLPEVSYLERRGIVGTATAPMTVATLRNPAIEQVHPETKPTYQIIVDLAEACGLGESSPSRSTSSAKPTVRLTAFPTTL